MNIIQIFSSELHQWVDGLAHNQEVGGSNPSLASNFKPKLDIM